MNVNKIVKLIILNIDKYCVTDDVFKQDIRLKRNYLLIEEQDIVKDDSIEKWLHFMPPLTTVKANHVQAITPTFKNKLRSNITKLNPKENTDIHILYQNNNIMLQNYYIKYNN